jgi:ligand-binding sensor domain-containing protein
MGHPSFGEDDRSVLIGTDIGIRRIVNGRIERYASEDLLDGVNACRQPTGGLGMLRDRDGALWIATRDRGLVHVSEGRTDAFSDDDGLSEDTVIDLFEDSEGTIWP